MVLLIDDCGIRSGDVGACDMTGFLSQGRGEFGRVRERSGSVTALEGESNDALPGSVLALVIRSLPVVSQHGLSPSGVKLRIEHGKTVCTGGRLRSGDT